MAKTQRRIPSNLGEDMEEEGWEHLVPDRFKKVCTKETFEPFYAPHVHGSWWE